MSATVKIKWRELNREAIKVTSIEEAKKWIEEIHAEITSVMKEMAEAKTRSETAKLQSQHYTLIQNKYFIRDNMLKIARENYALKNRRSL